MKKYVWFCFLLAALVCSCSRPQTDKVRLILDTDLGPDYDDVGAMAVMHALADSGCVDILAVMSSNHDERVLPCVDVLNTYFGRPDIPLGAPKGEGGVSLTSGHRQKWTDYLPAHYPHRIAKTSDAPDAVKLYRKILSHSADSTVVICTVGFFTNLSNLLVSPPDEYSELPGSELVARKVKRVVAMAAHFPEGREFNVYCDAPASVKVIREWPTEIIFSGFEIGEKILVGRKIIASDLKDNPVKDTYALCMAEGDKDGRMSWDLTAVWVAICGYEPYYTVERGTVRVADDGSNTWQTGSEGKHLRLIEKSSPSEMADLLEQQMMHRPVEH